MVFELTFIILSLTLSMPVMFETTLNFLTAMKVLLSVRIAEYTMLELPRPMISPWRHFMMRPNSIGVISLGIPSSCFVF